MVKDSAFAGSSILNPFNLQHFGLASFTLYIDSKPFPYTTTDIDFLGADGSQLYANAFVMLYEGLSWVFKGHYNKCYLP